MKLKVMLILAVIGIVALSGINLSAEQSVTFLQDGNVITDTIVDMSSRNGQVEYRRSPKIHKSRIWMINYENGQWDFPGERQQLSRGTDTIFLRNGHRLNVTVVDFSSRRRMFEFKKGGSVHESKVKRLYFCCVNLPSAYNDKQKKKPQQDDFQTVTFMIDGRVIDSPLNYMNTRKTGFQDGLQVNTRDIWMINLEDESLDYPNERRQMDRRLDTIFLTNGRRVHDTVIDFNARRGEFRFDNIDPIHYSKINRIYFCCKPFPNALKNKLRQNRFKRGVKRKVRRKY